MVIVIIISILCVALAAYVGVRAGSKRTREQLQPALQATEQVNSEIVAFNEEQEARQEELKVSIVELTAQKTAILASIEDLQAQADNTAAVYEKKAIEVAQLKIEASLAEQGAKFETASQEFEIEYLSTIKHAAAELQAQLGNKIAELNKINADIKTHKATREALIQANLREREIQEQIGFYTIGLTEQEIADIQALERIKPTLFKPEILSKLIWSTYFLQNVSTLCNKVFGTNKVCGIYKITNLNTKEAYIGQSVDCAERIKQHVKAGLGIDNKGTNKLYKAMQHEGVWNFSYELLESCPREELDKKEKEYIAIYESDKFGYNSTKGNG